jgi:hypothetical protein
MPSKRILVNLAIIDDVYVINVYDSGNALSCRSFTGFWA